MTTKTNLLLQPLEAPDFRRDGPTASALRQRQSNRNRLLLGSDCMTATARMPQAEQRAKPRPAPMTAAERDALTMGRTFPHSRLRSISFHEAGHALAATVLGVGVTSATIDANGEAGQVIHDKADALSMLRISVAGGVAECCSGRTRAPHRFHSLPDTSLIGAALRTLHGRKVVHSEYSTHYRSSVEWAFALMARQSADLSRIAALLSIHKTISGRAVRHAIHEAAPSG